MRISVINDDAATEVISPLGYISVFPFHCVFFFSHFNHEQISFFYD